VAAYDPAGQARDAIAVVDCDPSSATYGQVVGWAELPTAGNELHHFAGTPARPPCATPATATTASRWSAAT
jgi:56kDa selenium binding protein (SBP56)